MRRAARCAALAAALVVAGRGGDAAAQEFQPPAAGPARGTRLGLFGFGVRSGLDLTGPGQMVFGVTLDIGDLFNDRARLRPSAEIGVFNGDNTFVGSLEALFRLTGDAEMAIPYVGIGGSLAGRENCGQVPECPDLWLNIVFGFELRFRSTFNWLLEYHGMDALGRHRFYAGLTTRRGG